MDVLREDVALMNGNVLIQELAKGTYGYGSSNGGITIYRADNYASIYGDGDDVFYDDSANFIIKDGVLVKYTGWQPFVEIRIQ